ncbi:MAG: hypothetical protein ACYDDF_04095 [Thermoplasmatota archaeon]
MPPRPGSSRPQLQNRLRTLWALIADLKRVAPGDIAFLHSDVTIHGPFVIRSPFLESAALPEPLASPNVSLERWLASRDAIAAMDMPAHGYVATLEAPRGAPAGGIPMEEFSLRRAAGLIGGFAPRGTWGEATRVVKPLLAYEVAPLLDLVHFSGDWSVREGAPATDRNLRPIRLNLKSVKGRLTFETILEAWILEHFASPGADRRETSAYLGAAEHYANALTTHAGRIVDLVLYDAPRGTGRCEGCGGTAGPRARNVRVIDLVRDESVPSPETLERLQSAMRWATLALAPEEGAVSGILVAPRGGSGRCGVPLPANVHAIEYIADNGQIQLERTSGGTPV